MIVTKELKEEDGVFRKPELIAGATKKMAVTYIVGAVCAALVTIIDSLIAGVSMGQEALAAIATAGPLLCFDQILHCMLGFGIDKLMIQAIGEGDHKKANRIFGAILIAVFVIYACVSGALIVCERPLLMALTQDPKLSDMVVSYTVPLFVFSAFSEVFLCIERAFRIDGRARLFSKRGIVTNVANIAFDLLLVSVFNFGIAGLAWASVISTTIGYTVTLSHFFSKKRTVSPDFSVIHSFDELLDYVKQDIRLGSSATLDEILDTVALSVQTAAIGSMAGAGGLAIWTVYKSLRGVVVSEGNGISASVSVHAGLLFGQRDYDGVRYSIRSGITLAISVCVAAISIVLVLATPIAAAYGIDPEIRQLCAECLRIGSLAFLAMVFLNVTTIYLPSVNKTRIAGRLVLLEHGLVVLATGIGLGLGLGLQSIFVAYVLAEWVAASVAAVILTRDGHWLVPDCNPQEIVSYSICLRPDQIVTVGENIISQLHDRAYPSRFCARVSQVIQESISYVAGHNPGEEIDTDVEIKEQDDGVTIMITDAGVPYNPLAETTTRDMSKVGELEKVIILGFSEEVSYDRVLDLNRMALYLVPAEASQTSASAAQATA